MSTLTNSGKYIDSFRFAKEGQSFEGMFAIKQMNRLDDVALNPEDVFEFRIEGIIGDKGWPGAILNLRGVLKLTCYRCNKPMLFPINEEVLFRFTKTEEEADAIPIEEDDEVEVIVGSSKLNVLQWIEEEILLCIPLRPVHDEDCMKELKEQKEKEEKKKEEEKEEEKAPNPFAQLLGLKGLRKSDE